MTSLLFAWHVFILLKRDSFKVDSRGSYLFLRMKLLLENLKLCWGTHDILLPMLILGQCVYLLDERVLVYLPARSIELSDPCCNPTSLEWVSECVFTGETRLILKQQTGERGVYERGSVSVGGDKVRCVWAGGRREMKTGDQSNEVHTFCLRSLH